MAKCFTFIIIKIFFIIQQSILFCYAINNCQNRKIGIFDEKKFPNSSFSHFRSYAHYKPFEARLFVNGPETSWHTIDYGSSWIEVDLGLYFYFEIFN